MRNLLIFCSLVSLLVLIAGCADQDQDPELEMRISSLEADLEVANAENASAQKTIEGLRAEMRNTLEENGRLRDRLEILTINNSDQRIAKLERALEEAEAEATNYRVGLEKAVETLNQQAQKHQLDSYLADLKKSPSKRPSQRSRKSSNKKEECCVRAYTPYLTHVDRTVIISGDVKNTRSVEAMGEVLVELFDGNEVVKSESVRLTLPAQLEDSYEVTFSVSDSYGQYRARATWSDL